MPSNKISFTKVFKLPSPTLHDSKGSEQSSQRKSPHDDPYNPSLAITTVVPRSNGNSIQQPILLSFIKPIILWSVRQWIKDVLREAGIDTEIFNGDTLHVQP